MSQIHPSDCRVDWTSQALVLCSETYGVGSVLPLPLLTLLFITEPVLIRSVWCFSLSCFLFCSHVLTSAFPVFVFLESVCGHWVLLTHFSHVFGSMRLQVALLKKKKNLQIYFHYKVEQRLKYWIALHHAWFIRNTIIIFIHVYELHSIKHSKEAAICRDDKLNPLWPTTVCWFYYKLICWLSFLILVSLLSRRKCKCFITGRVHLSTFLFEMCFVIRG